IGYLGTMVAYAQDTEQGYHQYKGEVIDSNTKKPLVFATISLGGTNISTVTNAEGQFSLKVPNDVQGDHILITFLGYRSKSIPLLQFSEDQNRIPMEVSVTELPEVDI